MATSRKSGEALRASREAAWVGDAVLGLFAREWILRAGKGMDAEKFVRMTSNQFLGNLGNPTEVEARIGRCYQQSGLAAAFEMVERELLPAFLKQEGNRARKPRG
jgi:dsRNA-specific ribonuclease